MNECMLELQQIEHDDSGLNQLVENIINQFAAELIAKCLEVLKVRMERQVTILMGFRH